MKIKETYIIWLKDLKQFAKLHICENSNYNRLNIVETKTDMYEVSTDFIIQQNWI